jgi:hypothetical protein
MPRSTHIEIGLSTGLPERLSQRNSRIQSAATFAGEAFGRRYPVSAKFRPEPGIMQWLIAQLPCGHPTPVLARVKGRNLEPSQGVLPGRADSGANS